MSDEDVERLLDCLPPDESAEARRLMHELGGKEVVQIIVDVMERNLPYREAVEKSARGLAEVERTVEETADFIGDLRSEGRSFTESWAAMTLLLGVVKDRDALASALGYALAKLGWAGVTQDDTPERAAEKAKAARKVADEFNSLVDALRDGQI